MVLYTTIHVISRFSFVFTLFEQIILTFMDRSVTLYANGRIVYKSIKCIQLAFLKNYKNSRTDMSRSLKSGGSKDEIRIYRNR